MIRSASFDKRLVLDWLLSISITGLFLAIYFQILGRGFFHDDWTFLARAVGYLPAHGVLTRPVSFDLYWRVMDYGFGMNPIAYTLSRILIYSLTGFVIAAIVYQLKKDRLQALLSQAVFLISPLAFEPLFWASGVVDLLAILGLAVAVYGLVRRGEAGWVLYFVGGVVCLGSKEVGWWLPACGFLVWYRLGDRRFLVPSVSLAIMAIVGFWTTFKGLGGDYSWTMSAVPWGLVRSGSWLLPRTDDLLFVWNAGRQTIIASIIVWASWAAWIIYKWKQGDLLPLVIFVMGILSVVPAIGLYGHFVPRYILPLQACVAVTIGLSLSSKLPYRRCLVLGCIVILFLMSQRCVHGLLEKSYPSGRKVHRLVAKEMLAKDVWRALEVSGVSRRSGVVFLCRPEDDVAAREELLNVIGRSWGPMIALELEAPVIITDDISEVPLGVPTFGFVDGVLEYLGVLKRTDG